MQEAAVRASGLAYAIVCPTLVFGPEDILVNNIAWTIRRFPVVPIFGSGRYRVQPVFVGDLARITVEAAHSPGSQTLDAVGPETFTYGEFLKLIARGLNRRVAFVRVPPAVGIALGKVIGAFVKDVVLTRDELRGLMAEKLTSTQPPNGDTLFTDWLRENHHRLGTGYTSELGRHFYWKSAADG